MTYWLNVYSSKVGVRRLVCRHSTKERAKAESEYMHQFGDRILYRIKVTEKGPTK